MTWSLATIALADAESLPVAVGCVVIEGNGSRASLRERRSVVILPSTASGEGGEARSDQGRTPAADDYIETCRKPGKKPHKSYSGKTMFRVESLDQWAEVILSRAAGKLAA
ncbi:toxin-antitoxin system HicB family antitoxin [Rhizobium yanglingense]